MTKKGRSRGRRSLEIVSWHLLARRTGGESAVFTFAATFRFAKREAAAFDEERRFLGSLF
jgi:hypothetical protein